MACVQARSRMLPQAFHAAAGPRRSSRSLSRDHSPNQGLNQSSDEPNVDSACNWPILGTPNARPSPKTDAASRVWISTSVAETATDILSLYELDLRYRCAFRMKDGEKLVQDPDHTK
ncbi:hypothetical protein ABVK25_003186 [Lepraria finkii]|uniref:Uncharacterized protein n=1 Tax=Lepraria finkii TaxID=1340010 RepID=A0ABR4BIZ9_9LECA